MEIPIAINNHFNHCTDKKTEVNTIRHRFYHLKITFDPKNSRITSNANRKNKSILGTYLRAYTGIIIKLYLELPKGAKWFLMGVKSPSLRIQLAPLGRCWYDVQCIFQLNRGTSSSTSPRASETVHSSSYGRIDKTKQKHKKMQLQQNLMSSPKKVSNELITNCRLI